MLDHFTLWQRARLVARVVAALALAALATSCKIYFTPPQQDAPSGRAGGDTTVHLIADYIHSGLVFRTDWLESCGFRFPPGFHKKKYVTMSWGDEEAMASDNLSLAHMLKTITFGSKTAYELIPFEYDVASVCPHQDIYVGRMTHQGGEKMVKFLRSLSLFDSGGNLKECGRSTWGDGVLIACNQKYYFPRICNVWTSSMLYYGGVKLRRDCITSKAIVRQVIKSPNNFKLISKRDNSFFRR